MNNNIYLKNFIELFFSALFIGNEERFLTKLLMDLIMPLIVNPAQSLPDIVLSNAKNTQQTGK
jgi:hypothetical protein